MPVLTVKGNDKMWEGRTLTVLTYMSGLQLLHQHELPPQRNQLQQSLPAGPVDYAIDSGQLARHTQNQVLVLNTLLNIICLGALRKYMIKQTLKNV